jgi:hypothetical protein
MKSRVIINAIDALEMVKNLKTGEAPNMRQWEQVMHAWCALKVDFEETHIPTRVEVES